MHSNNINQPMELLHASIDQYSGGGNTATIDTASLPHTDKITIDTTLSITPTSSHDTDNNLHTDNNNIITPKSRRAANTLIQSLPFTMPHHHHTNNNMNPQQMMSTHNTNSTINKTYLTQHDPYNDDMELHQLYKLSTFEITIRDLTARRGGAKVVALTFSISNYSHTETMSQYITCTIDARIYSKKAFFNKYLMYTRGTYCVTQLNHDAYFTITESNMCKQLVMLRTNESNTNIPSNNQNNNVSATAPASTPTTPHNNARQAPTYALSADVPYIITFYTRSNTSKVQYTALQRADSLVVNTVPHNIQQTFQQPSTTHYDNSINNNMNQQQHAITPVNDTYVKLSDPNIFTPPQSALSNTQPHSQLQLQPSVQQPFQHKQSHRSFTPVDSSVHHPYTAIPITPTTSNPPTQYYTPQAYTSPLQQQQSQPYITNYNILSQQQSTHTHTPPLYIQTTYKLPGFSSPEASPLEDEIRASLSNKRPRKSIVTTNTHYSTHYPALPLSSTFTADDNSPQYLKRRNSASASAGPIKSPINNDLTPTDSNTYNNTIQYSTAPQQPIGIRPKQSTSSYSTIPSYTQYNNINTMQPLTIPPTHPSTQYTATGKQSYTAAQPLQAQYVPFYQPTASQLQQHQISPTLNFVQLPAQSNNTRTLPQSFLSPSLHRQIKSPPFLHSIKPEYYHEEQTQ